MNAWQSTIETVIPRIGWTLVHSLWEAVAIAGLLALVLRLMRNAPASRRYVACCVALAATVASVSVTFVMIGEAPAVAVRVDVAPSVFIVPDEAGQPVAMPAPTLKRDAAPTDRENILRGVVLVWLAGVVVMSIRQIGGWVCLVSMRGGRTLAEFEPVMERLRSRLNIRRAVRLIETARLDVPAVMGVLRPVIFISLGVLNDLTPQQVEAILAHELAHVRRHDYLVNLLQATIESLMFYHPAVWWISNCIRAEREHCCDDIARSICGDGTIYAAALATLESRRDRAIGNALAPSSSGGDLLGRVRRILNLPPTPRRFSVRSLAVAVLALGCLALPLLVHAQQQKPATATTTQTSDIDHPSPIVPDDLVAHPEDDRVMPHDLLSISITDPSDNRETVKNARVGNAGEITVPRIGAMKVDAKSVSQIETAIVKAYADAGLFPHAKVSVQIVEALGHIVSVMGAVDRPGQYLIDHANYRVLDAIAAAKGDVSKLDAIYVIRGEGESKRTIKIPVADLAGKDSKVNIIIRFGDLIVAPGRTATRPTTAAAAVQQTQKPFELTGMQKAFPGNDVGPQRVEGYGTVTITADKSQPASARVSAMHGPITNPEPVALSFAARTTQPSTQPGFVNVTVSRTDLFYEGRSVNMGQLHKIFEMMPAEQRHQTVLTVEAASSDVPVDRYFQAIGALDQIVHEMGFAYLSQIGIHATTQAAAPTTAPATARTSEYYMTGHIAREGVYSLTARQKISLKQAIVAAGGVDAGFENSILEVIHRVGNDRQDYDEFRIDDLLNGRVRDIFLQPNDVVRVGSSGKAIPSTQQANLSAPPPESAVGDYFIGGEVARGGGYVLSKRHITLKQAINAAGGLSRDMKALTITIIRRDENDKECIALDHASAEACMSKADVYLWPNDLIQVTRAVETAGATTKAASSLTVDQIATIDPTMRKYVKQRDTASSNLAQIEHRLGQSHPAYINEKAAVDLANRRLDEYAAEYRRHFVGTYLDPTSKGVIPLTQEMKDQMQEGGAAPIP